MISVMAIRGEVFGICVEEINISVEIENKGVSLCCWWKYMRLFWGGKAAQKSVLVVGDGARYWRLIECFGFH